MSSRQIIQTLLIALAVCIFVLLMVPVVHVPCIVVHGPTTALRAQRAAWLFDFLIRAAAFLFAGILLLAASRWPAPQEDIFIIPVSADLSLNCALRC